MKTFFQNVFHSITAQRARELPKTSYTSVSTALFDMCNILQIPREYLARNVGMTTENLVGLERRGYGITQERMHRLSCFAHDHNLHEIGDYFERAELLARDKKAKGRKRGGYDGYDDFASHEE